MGNKLEARSIARNCGVPLLPGSERVETAEEAARLAREIGFPILLKAAAGGGGRGMKLVHSAEELPAAFSTASAEVRAAFGDPTIYMERYVANARHVEVQVMGDLHGHVVHLGERDCSAQRRHQKIVEEAPAFELPAETRQRLWDAAVALAQHIGYASAGTVEFLVDRDSGAFYFLEMNTRIQVEHPVTESVTGIDLVQLQLRIAEGEPLPFAQGDVTFRGHAIECRINAESPAADFRPSPGRITAWRPPRGGDVRLDTHCFEGYVVPPFYDSLLAKLIVSGVDRGAAVDRLRRALDDFEVGGIETNIPFLRRLVREPAFVEGKVHTRFVESVLKEAGMG